MFSIKEKKDSGMLVMFSLLNSGVCLNDLVVQTYMYFFFYMYGAFKRGLKVQPNLLFTQ